MVTLPKEFIATKFHGYFWNINEGKLYSVKVTGALRPLVRSKPSRWNHYRDGYSVSVDGNKRFLGIDYLNTLKPKNSVFPVVDN